MNAERLLVVEDDKYLRDEILRVLERRTSYRVDAAADGEEALKKAESNHYEVLITDVRMPGMDGIELLEQLKANQPSLASIIITAFADEQATIRALKIGANDYIRKPFSIRDLINAIDRQVTVLRLREDAERSRRFMEGLVASVQAGVLAIDSDGDVAAVNQRALEILQFDEKMIIGHNAIDVLSSVNEARGEEVVRILKELASKRTRALERDLTVQQAGLPVTYRLSGTSIRNEEGRELGVVLLFNDVSELIQAQKLNAWKDLARTVAHEIKNPLTPIKLSAQQLASAKKSGSKALEEQFEIALANIIKNADRLDALASEFSRFGRLPQKEMIPVDITSVLSEALEPCLSGATAAGIEIVKNFDSSLPHISGDPESLLRMMGNLINNAMEAMPKGGVLTVSAGVNEDSMVAISVEDTGEGIKQELKDSLFKPYVTSKAGGTGLGLVVVKEVVSSHDGELTVTSEPGRGTIFTITFPALKN